MKRIEVKSDDAGSFAAFGKRVAAGAKKAARAVEETGRRVVEDNPKIAAGAKRVEAGAEDIGAGVLTGLSREAMDAASREINKKRNRKAA